MAQIKLLKISASDGVPLEFDSAADDITLASFTVQGGGPVLGATGLDLNGQDVTDVSDLVFTDPSVGTINQTAGALVVDNLMAKERNNVMSSAGAVLFGVVTDTAGQLDSFKVPHIAGAPTATPAFSSDAGYLAYDATNKSLYAWDGSAWDDLSTVSQAASIVNSYTAGVGLAANDAVYISAADTVQKALGDSTSKAQLIGFASAAALITAPVSVQSEGVMAGFTGLTSGARYYLDATTAGALTASVPAGAGNTIVQAGYAKSATNLHIHIQQLGRRA